MNIEIKEQNGSYLGILTGWIDTAEATGRPESIIGKCRQEYRTGLLKVRVHLQFRLTRSVEVKERECSQRRFTGTDPCRRRVPEDPCNDRLY